MRGVSTRQRTCLLVLGMHRSGTSALTRVLNLLGAGLPRTLIGASEGNDTGHWEPLRLVLLHDRMLEEAGSSWDDWQRFDIVRLSRDRRAHYRSEACRIVAEDFCDDGLVVLKDPRICRFVPFMADVLAGLDIDLKPVLMMRDPLEVCASLEHRNRMGHAQAMLLWLRHMLDAEKETRGFERAFVDFSDLLNDWRRVRDAVAARTGAGLATADAGTAALIETFLSPDRRHHNADGGLGGANGMGDWIETVAVQYRVLAAEGERPGALRELDRVGCEFDHAAPFLAGMEAHHRGQYSSTVDARVSRGVRLAKTYLRPFHRQRPRLR